MDTPFHILMQQAAALKTDQMSVNRRKYDAKPPWYQSSLYAKDDIYAARKLPFVDRLAFAVECKEKGNTLFKETNDAVKEREAAVHGNSGQERSSVYEWEEDDTINAEIRNNYSAALNEYERALSVFDYAEPLNDDWKKRAIEDDHIKDNVYVPADNVEKESLTQLKVSCLLNIAACYQKLRQWSSSIKACDAVLEIEHKNVKALYRRAQARILPKSCGAAESEAALKDLKIAAMYAPTDAAVVGAYRSLMQSIKDQKEIDKKRAGRLFNPAKSDPIYAPSAVSKPSSSTGSSNDDFDIVEISTDNMTTSPSSSSPLPTSSSSSSSSNPSSASSDSDDGTSMTAQEALMKAKDLRSAALRFEQSGDREMANKLFKQAILIEKEIQGFLDTKVDYTERQRQVDKTLESLNFTQPTEEMIQEAKKMGIDLTNIRIQKLMAELQRDAIAKKKADEEARKNNNNNNNSASTAEGTGTGKGKGKGNGRGNGKGVSINEGDVDKAFERVKLQEAREIALNLICDHDEASMIRMIKHRKQYNIDHGLKETLDVNAGNEEIMKLIREKKKQQQQDSAKKNTATNTTTDSNGGGETVVSPRQRRKRARKTKRRCHL